MGRLVLIMIPKLGTIRNHILPHPEGKHEQHNGAAYPCTSICYAYQPFGQSISTLWSKHINPVVKAYEPCGQSISTLWSKLLAVITLCTPTMAHEWLPSPFSEAKSTPSTMPSGANSTVSGTRSCRSPATLEASQRSDTPWQVVQCRSYPYTLGSRVVVCFIFFEP